MVLAATRQRARRPLGQAGRLSYPFLTAWDSAEGGTQNFVQFLREIHWHYERFCARRLASRSRLVVCVPSGFFSSFDGCFGSGADNCADAAVSSIVGAFTGLKRSGMGSALVVFARTSARRASNASRDSSASIVRGLPRQKNTFERMM